MPLDMDSVGKEKMNDGGLLDIISAGLLTFAARNLADGVGKSLERAFGVDDQSQVR